MSIIMPELAQIIYRTLWKRRAWHTSLELGCECGLSPSNVREGVLQLQQACAGHHIEIREKKTKGVHSYRLIAHVSQLANDERPQVITQMELIPA